MILHVKINFWMLFSSSVDFEALSVPFEPYANGDCRGSENVFPKSNFVEGGTRNFNAAGTKRSQCSDIDLVDFARKELLNHSLVWV